MERYIINRHIRQHLKIKGCELAKRVEVSKQTISNYERGVGGSRHLERVIELELDLAIEKCDDELVKEFCEYLKLKRSGGV